MGVFLEQKLICLVLRLLFSSPLNSWMLPLLFVFCDTLLCICEFPFSTVWQTLYIIVTCFYRLFGLFSEVHLGELTVFTLEWNPNILSSCAEMKGFVRSRQAAGNGLTITGAFGMDVPDSASISVFADMYQCQRLVRFSPTGKLWSHSNYSAPQLGQITKILKQSSWADFDQTHALIIWKFESKRGLSMKAFVYPESHSVAHSPKAQPLPQQPIRDDLLPPFTVTQWHRNDGTSSGVQVIFPLLVHIASRLSKSPLSATSVPPRASVMPPSECHLTLRSTVTKWEGLLLFPIAHCMTSSAGLMIQVLHVGATTRITHATFTSYRMFGNKWWDFHTLQGTKSGRAAWQWFHMCALCFLGRKFFNRERITRQNLIQFPRQTTQFMFTGIKCALPLFSPFALSCQSALHSTLVYSVIISTKSEGLLELTHKT